MNAPPPLMRHITLTLLLLLVPLAVYHYLLRVPNLATPLRMQIEGLPQEMLDQDFPTIKVKIIAISQQGGGMYLQHVERTPYWFPGSGIWVQKLYFQISEDVVKSLDRLDITIGDVDHLSFDRAAISKWKHESPQLLHLRPDQYAPGDLLLQIPTQPLRTSKLPWQDSTPWNWPGDAVFLRGVARYAFLPCVLVLLLGFFCARIGTPQGKEWLQNVLDSSPPLRGGTRRGATGYFSLANWIGFAFLVAMLTLLEVHSPYYFTQDDNLIESLPMILVGCRNIWNGIFPEYNPYLFLGMPLASLGMYSLTYPPLHLSYAIARHVLGNEYATVEVFAIFHLLVGFFATRLLSRKLGMGPLPANLTALSCVLSGAALIMGRCWFNFMPIMTWMPLLLLGLVRLQRGPVGWLWIVLMGLSFGLTFHVGFTQAAIYVNSFFCLAVLFLAVTGALPWKRTAVVIPALLIGAGLAVPLVYQQWLLSLDTQRSPLQGLGIGKGLAALLLPYPLVETALPSPMGNKYLQFAGHFYFFGGVLAFLCIAQVMGLFFFRASRKTWSGHVWTFCALIAFWLALGDTGLLWELLSHLPKVGFIHRYPMRVMPFVVIFGSISGGLMLERLLHVGVPPLGGVGVPPLGGVGVPPLGGVGVPPLGGVGVPPLGGSPPNRLKAELQHAIIGGVALLLLLIHTFHSQIAFYTYGFKPYPELPEKLHNILFERDPATNEDRPTGRVASWVHKRSGDPNYALLMHLDLPAVYRLPTFDGYNPLVGDKPQVQESLRAIAQHPREAMKAYGLRWNFSHHPNRLPGLSSVYSGTWPEEARFKGSLLTDKLVLDDLPKPFDEDGVVVHELTPVDPLAFPKDHPSKNLPVHLSGRGIDVALEPSDNEQVVVVNFLHYPNIRSYVDGEETKCTYDDYHRMVVKVPPGQHRQLAIRYRPPWLTGILLGLGVAAAGVVLAAFLRRLENRIVRPGPSVYDGTSLR